MNSVTRSNIDILLAMLTNNRHWVRAKAIYFVEQQLSGSVDRSILQEIQSGLQSKGKELPEDTKGLSAVLDELLSKPERTSLAR